MQLTKRRILVILALLLVVATASAQHATPAAQHQSSIQIAATAAQHGWSAQEIKAAMNALETQAPNVSHAQDECAFAYVSSRYSPAEYLHLSSSAASELNLAAAQSCH